MDNQMLAVNAKALPAAMSFSEYDNRTFEEKWRGYENCTAPPLEPMMQTLWVGITFGTFYSVVFVLGLTGNLFIFYSLFFKKISLGVNSYLIVSLTVSDLLITCFSLPVTFTQNLVGYWVFGNIACKAVPWIQGGSIFVSTITLVVIAVDRYRTVGTYHSRRSCCLRFAVLAAIWLVGFMAASPLLVVLKSNSYFMYPTYGICNFSLCQENWGQGMGHVKKIYGTSVFLVQFLIPLIIMGFCYERLRREVVKSTLRRLSYPSITEATRNNIHKRPKKTLYIIVLVCMAFAVSWLPMNVLNLMRDFGFTNDHFNTLFAATHAVAMTSVVWNPIIYCFLNHDFKREMQGLIGCRTPRNQSMAGSAPKFRTVTSPQFQSAHANGAATVHFDLGGVEEESTPMISVARNGSTAVEPETFL